MTDGIKYLLLCLIVPQSMSRCRDFMHSVRSDQEDIQEEDCEQAKSSGLLSMDL